MKYAIFSNDVASGYEKIVRQINMGDNFVSMASKLVLNNIGVNDEEIVRIPFSREGYFDTEDEMKLIVCGHFRKQYEMDFMSQKNIHPVYLGYGITDPILSKIEVEKYKQYEPILCRDEFTRNIMRKNGIRAYLFGCLTLLFPKYVGRRGKKIFLIDVKEELIDKLPTEIKENAIILSQNIQIDEISNEEMKWGEMLSCDRLEMYKRDARAVLTPKLHCMTPCVALGIPVAAVGNNFSYRYSYIDAFVDVFDPANIKLDEIKENTNIELLKPQMMDVATSLVKGVAKMDAIQEIDDFYDRRIKWDYLSAIRQKIEDFFDRNMNEFIIWGASAGGYAIYSYIVENFGNLTPVAIIDEYIDGEFGNLVIKKAKDVLIEYPNTPIIISTLSGREAASSLLRAMGKRENVDFIFLHENM